MKRFLIFIFIAIMTFLVCSYSDQCKIAEQIGAQPGDNITPVKERPGDYIITNQYGQFYYSKADQYPKPNHKKDMEEVRSADRQWKEACEAQDREYYRQKAEWTKREQEARKLVPFPQ